MLWFSLIIPPILQAPLKPTSEIQRTAQQNPTDFVVLSSLSFFLLSSSGKKGFAAQPVSACPSEHSAFLTTCWKFECSKQLLISPNSPDLLSFSYRHCQRGKQDKEVLESFRLLFISQGEECRGFK